MIEWHDIVLLAMGIAAIAGVSYAAARIAVAVIDYLIIGRVKKRKWWKPWTGPEDE